MTQQDDAVDSLIAEYGGEDGPKIGRVYKRRTMSTTSGLHAKGTVLARCDAGHIIAEGDMLPGEGAYLLVDAHRVDLFP